jgi:hypothetical protein
MPAPLLWDAQPQDEGDEMAVEPSTTESHSGDMKAHVRDYSRFTGMLKWGAILSFVLAMIVVFIIGN